MTVDERALAGAPATDRTWRCPSHFRYWEARNETAWRRRERLVKRLFGHDLFPSDERARMLCDDLYGGDPVAERYVDEVFFGETGHRRGREQLMQALEHGIDSVPDAPESMKALFAEFDTLPDWVDREQVELGAEIWRRWGTMLFSVAGAITLEAHRARIDSRNCIHCYCCHELCPQKAVALKQGALSRLFQSQSVHRRRH